MIFIKKFANNFLLKDSIVEANADVYGGPAANFIVLHSIQAVEPVKEGLNSGPDLLVAYLAEQVRKEKNWETITVVKNNTILFTTSNEVKKEKLISTRVQRLNSGEALGFAFRSMVQAIREIFNRKA